jgi:hypothetical protein
VYSLVPAVLWLGCSLLTVALPGVVRLGLLMTSNTQISRWIGQMQDQFSFLGPLCALAVFVLWPLVYWASAIRSGLSLRPWLRPYLLVAATILVPFPTVMFLIEIMGVYV